MLSPPCDCTALHGGDGCGDHLSDSALPFTVEIGGGGQPCIVTLLQKDARMSQSWILPTTLLLVLRQPLSQVIKPSVLSPGGSLQDGCVDTSRVIWGTQTPPSWGRHDRRATFCG